MIMRPVIIGAGRGSRLEHLTEEIPKTLVPVMGRPMLDWVLEALGAAGFTRKDVVFICGYRAEVIRAAPSRNDPSKSVASRPAIIDYHSCG